MKNCVKAGYIITSIIFFVYLIIPNPTFPNKPEEALQSDEPADIESFYRRAYFTNLDREEVMRHYLAEMKEVGLFRLKLPTYRLNYPPEESQTIIRDQTRSTYLEEIVHPFRESIYVNGFEPKNEKDKIFIQEKLWVQKIIIKQINSTVFVRFLIGLMCITIIPVIFKNIAVSLKDLRKEMPKLWTFQ